MAQHVSQLPVPRHLPMPHSVPAARNSGESPARPRRCADAVVRASLDVHASARLRQKLFGFGLLTTLRCGCAQRVRVSWARRAR
jgi:hypothetical protein